MQVLANAARSTGCLTSEMKMEANARILEDIRQKMEALQSEGKPETAEQELARLRRENAQLRVAKAERGALTCKVTPKGGVSVYGMGRWPVTLYRDQWERLLAQSDHIIAFIEANAASLSTK